MKKNTLFICFAILVSLNVSAQSLVPEKSTIEHNNKMRSCLLVKLDVPVFIIAMEKDYISPPRTAFVTTELVSGPIEFILGESGHVMGVANPPSKKKYGYYLNGKLGKGYDEFQKTAKFHEGSWWTAWSEKLKEKSGKQTPSPKFPGNGKYKEIEPAPGKYVKEKCEVCFDNTKRMNSKLSRSKLTRH